MPSAILYGFIFFITGVLSEYTVRIEDYLKEEKVKKIIFILLILSIPAFFAGIRYEVGTDYLNYVNIFSGIRKNGFNSRFELGFNLINYTVAQFGGDVQIVFFIMFLLTILFVYLFLYEYRNQLNIGIGIFIFLVMFYNSSLNIVRQGLATMIALYAIQFMDKQKLKPFLFFVLLATSFHVGAIVLIPVYIVYNLLLHQRMLYRVIFYVVFLLVLANYQIIVEVISIEILNTDKYLYLARDSERNIALGAFVLYAPHLLVGFIFYEGLMRENKSFKLFYFLLVIGYLMGFLPAFGAPMPLRRIANFFTAANIWLVPYYYQYFKTKTNYSWLIPLLIFYVLLTWYAMYILGGNADTVPYNTIFNF